MLAAYASDQKRSHLVHAAKQLIHEQGLERTTFAHVAARADVPLGNVYYYFKTKEALAESAIASHEADLREAFAAWAAAHREPRARLRRFVRGPLHCVEDIIKFGCPHGSLCQELEKLAAKEPLAKAATRLLSAYIDWADEQFRAHGFPKRKARQLATELVAAVQGTMLVAHTLRSRELLTTQLRRVEHWLDATLSAGEAA